MSVLPHKVIHDDPPSPRRLNRHVPRDLETICLKCLQKSPEQRYQSAKLLADDLQNWLGGMPIVARPIGKVETMWRLVSPTSTDSRTGSLTARSSAFRSCHSGRVGSDLAIALEANKRDIRLQCATELRDLGLTEKVQNAASEITSVKTLAQELTAEYQSESPPHATLLDFVEQQQHESLSDRRDLPIEVINWFLLDSQGILRASSDENHGRRVLGTKFDQRDYFKDATADAAYIGEPYPSENDGHYKVPVSAKCVAGDEFLGVIVASVTTPGTRGLDDQQNFLHGLYVLVGVFLTPLAVFLVAAAMGLFRTRQNTLYSPSRSS